MDKGIEWVEVKTSVAGPDLRDSYVEEDKDVFTDEVGISIPWGACRVFFPWSVVKWTRRWTAPS
jgi:hypothetical protein